MKLVIDANILFAALIKEGKTRELIFNKNLELYAPELLETELEKYTSLILNKTNLSNKEITYLKKNFLKKIMIFKEDFYEKEMIIAENICPDPFDIDYLSLSMKLNCPLWSNDKKLKTQTKVDVFSTNEIIIILSLVYDD